MLDREFGYRRASTQAKLFRALRIQSINPSSLNPITIKIYVNRGHKSEGKEIRLICMPFRRSHVIDTQPDVNV